MMLAESKSPDAGGAEASVDVSSVEATNGIEHPDWQAAISLDWQTGVFRCRAAMRTYLEYRTEFMEPAQRFGEVPDHLEFENERIVDECSAAQTALMALPSPDLSALRLKLDHVLELDQDKSLQPYSGTYIEQMLEDVARLLPETAEHNPLRWPE